MKTENKGRDYYRNLQKEMKEKRANGLSWFWISKLGDRVINGKVDKTKLNKGKTYIKDKEEK